MLDSVSPRRTVCVRGAAAAAVVGPLAARGGLPFAGVSLLFAGVSLLAISVLTRVGALAWVLLPEDDAAHAAHAAYPQDRL